MSCGNYPSNRIFENSKEKFQIHNLLDRYTQDYNDKEFYKVLLVMNLFLGDKIFLLDQPFSFLDSLEAEHLRKEKFMPIKKIKEELMKMRKI